MWQWNFERWYIFIKALENGFNQLSLYCSKTYRCLWELYDDLNQVKVYFGVKTFPVRDMKRCYLQIKATGITAIRDFRKAFSGVFVRLLAWKRGLPGPKFSFEILSPSPTLSLTKSQKGLICEEKVIEGPEAPMDLHW